MVNKEGSSPSLRCVRCPKVEIFFTKCCEQNYRALYGAALLEDLLGPLMWWQDSSVNM